MNPKESIITKQNDPASPESRANVAWHSDLISAYRVAEFVTLAHDGSPVCWPLAPELEGGRLIFSTGYMYPTKARNASAILALAVLPLGGLFWWGFALPIPPVFAFVWTLLILASWQVLR